MSRAQVTRPGALLEKIVGAHRARIERAAGDGKDRSSLLAGEAGRDQRARALGRLDHDDAERDPRDQPIAAGKILSPRSEAGRPLADEKAALADRPLQVIILGRIDDVDAAGEHGDGAMLERRKMRRRIDAAGEPEVMTNPSSARSVAIWRVNFCPTAEPLRAPTMATMGMSASSSLPLA